MREWMNYLGGGAGRLGVLLYSVDVDFPTAGTPILLLIVADQIWAELALR